MFDKLMNSLFGSAPEELPPEDARVALTALLVRIARSDGQYDDVEKDQIRDIVADRYDLSSELAQDLMYQAQELESQAPDTVRFTEAIKDAVPYEDRTSVVAAAWRVVLADGDRADEEDALMRLIAKFLGVSDRDSNIARQKAMG
ncbi:MAG: TerB family tellurite resistance protein [Maritimibacter sp.]|uniref:tellurite resistance TerB family protein n=1 Tax=Maritimibacter sp. TaxID=2003363 RepID=UPI001D9B9C47|nr:TerB family tellurite resistance protein [Maritimibacter sp.]MBL6429246.1 TerB family tellurite resistance protein [Maritimibacter sp.]